CTVALSDAIRAVLCGQDGCVLAIGHKQTGKTFSMLGLDNSPQNVGIIPCAISWLFRLLTQQQQTSGTRFSVRVSAVELHGPDECLRDLLANVVTSAEERLSPSQYLQPTIERTNGQCSSTVGVESDGRNVGSVATRIAKQLAQQSELQASTAEKAAQLLDIALSNRAHVINESESGLSHMLFTLHIYQCRVKRGESGTSVSGGRTRLHLFDLGCGRYSHQASSVSTTVRLGNKYSKRTSKHEKSHSKTHRSSEDSFIEANDFDRGTTCTHISTKCLSISGMANVLLALLTGQRYLPFRDSALTHLLKEAMTGNQMHPCIVAHIASGAQYYAETLQVIQLVSKLSRLRRRRVGPSPSTANSSLTSDQQTPAGSHDEAGSSSMDGVSESGRSNQCYRRFRGPRLGRSSYYSRSVASFSSELDFTSSSEQSCDTVIYLGQSVHTRGTRTERLANPLVSKLGPRGAADGSVDARSASSGHLSAGESSSIPHSGSGQTKQSSISTGESINTGHGFGLVKRMTPRTNATVWPRTFSLRRAKEVLQSQQETWVDGPRAMSVPVSPPAAAKPSARILSPSCDERELTRLLPSITVSKSSIAHSSVQLLSVKTSMPWVKEHFQDQFEGLATKPTFGLTEFRLPNTLVNSEHVQANHPNGNCGNTDDRQLLETVTFSPLAWQAKNGLELAMDNVLHTVPACDYAVLDHDSKRGQRALSDISERTEDTETVPDSNTLKSNSSNDVIDCLSVLNLETLSYPDISHAKYGYRTLNVSGGRTRLHLFDLGCGRYSHQASSVSTTVRLGNKYSKRTSKHEKSHSKTHRSSEDSFIEANDFDRGTTCTHISTKCLSISGMANVLLALLTGQRYLPFRDSALTHLLKEAMTGNQMHPCIVAHIASGAQYYAETLQVIQLVSKLSRLRRRRVGPSPSTANSSLTSDQQTPAGSHDEAGSSSMDGVSESGRSNQCYRRFRGPRLGRSSYYSRSVASFSSELDFTSSSEQSCDTVIYLGQSVHTRGTRTERLANPLVSKLGPRGAADGSVDARSASSGHLSA
ncbi:hypothetical protein AHF37_06948, partial [Paragonimus kellicotti]